MSSRLIRSSRAGKYDPRAPCDDLDAVPAAHPDAVGDDDESRIFYEASPPLARRAARASASLPISGSKLAIRGRTRRRPMRP
jgi:hypothetical protein